MGGSAEVAATGFAIRSPDRLHSSATPQSNHHQGATHALINVKVIEGVFTPEQKTQIAERLTDAMVSVEGENMRGVTWCVIDEVNSGDWAIGGQCLTTEAVHALAAGTAPQSA